MTTANDPAIQALKQGDEILAALDEMTKPQEAVVPPVVAEEPHVEAESVPAHQPMEEQLKALDAELNAAVDAGQEGEVRRLVEKAKEIVRAEKVFREKGLEDAEEYFNEALKEYGEQSEETAKASAEVANWRKSLENFDDYVVEAGKAYDDVLSGMQEMMEPSQEPTSPEPQQAVTEQAQSGVVPPEAAPVKESSVESLEELTAAVQRLKDLNAKIVALSKEVEKKKAIAAAKAKAGL